MIIKFFQPFSTLALKNNPLINPKYIAKEIQEALQNNSIKDVFDASLAQIAVMTENLPNEKSVDFYLKLSKALEFDPVSRLLAEKLLDQGLKKSPSASELLEELVNLKANRTIMTHLNKQT